MTQPAHRCMCVYTHICTSETEISQNHFIIIIFKSFWYFLLFSSIFSYYSYFSYYYYFFIFLLFLSASNLWVTGQCLTASFSGSEGRRTQAQHLTACGVRTLTVAEFKLPTNQLATILPRDPVTHSPDHVICFTFIQYPSKTSWCPYQDRVCSSYHVLKSHPQWSVCLPLMPSLPWPQQNVFFLNIWELSLVFRSFDTQFHLARKFLSPIFVQLTLTPPITA